MPAANIYVAQSWRGGEGSGLCLAAYLVWRSDVAEFGREWAAALETVGATYVRLSALAHGTQNFAAVGLDERVALERRLIEVTHRYTQIGVAAFSPASAHPPRDVQAYRASLSILLAAIGDWADDFGLDGSVGYFMAEDQADQRVVGAALDGRNALPTTLSYGFHSFGRKRRLMPLQAADMLAWLSLQAIPPQPGRPRNLRKDLLALLRPQDSVRIAVGPDSSARIWPVEAPAHCQL